MFSYQYTITRTTLVRQVAPPRARSLFLFYRAIQLWRSFCHMWCSIDHRGKLVIYVRKISVEFLSACHFIYHHFFSFFWITTSVSANIIISLSKQNSFLQNDPIGNWQRSLIIRLEIYSVWHTFIYYSKILECMLKKQQKTWKNACNNEVWNRDQRWKFSAACYHRKARMHRRLSDWQARLKLVICNLHSRFHDGDDTTDPARVTSARYKKISIAWRRGEGTSLNNSKATSGRYYTARI